jgi:squalene-associated FAD-dependent desaturase
MADPQQDSSEISGRSPQRSLTSDRKITTVAIIGGGLAGLAAACALADAGFKVSLFERRPYLGGRASSYEHPGTGEVVDNCQHVLFKLCTNLVDFYRKIGIDDKIRWFDSITFIEPGGRQSVLNPSSLPAPLHVTPSFLSFKFLDTRDKLALSRALPALILGSPKDDGSSFQDWLIRHRQTPRAIERFWKPILISALSEDLDHIAVPYAAQVVRESMLSRGARVMGVPTVPLTHLYDGAREYIVTRGGEVRLRSAVQSVQPIRHCVRIELQDSEEAFDYAVLAVPFDSLAKLLPESGDSRGLRDKLSNFETSPITGVHLWFDRQISDLPHAVLLDRTIQWMFHKSLLLGAVQAGDSLNSRTVHAQGTPSYVELVVSSSKALINKSRQEIIDLALKEVREFFPKAQDANLLKATVIKEVNATFSPRPGVDAYRPGPVTPWPNIFLAGDWTATGWPATMEGAVRSGYLAAEAITTLSGNTRKILVPDLPAGGLMRVWPRSRASR